MTLGKAALGPSQILHPFVDLLPVLFSSFYSSTQSTLTLSVPNMSSPSSDDDPQSIEGYDESIPQLLIECEDGDVAVPTYLFRAHR